MTTFLRRLRCLSRLKGQSIALKSLALIVILGVSIVFTGCAGEVLPEAFGVPQSSVQPPPSPPNQQNAIDQEMSLSQPDSAAAMARPKSEDIKPQFGQERKETRTMWFASKSGSVEHVSAADFKTAVLEADVPVLVDFYADWCGPCRALAPVLEQLAQETQGVRIVKVNVDQAPSLAAQYRVSAIPTLILFNQGKPVQRMTGLMTKEELKRALGVN